MPPHTGTSLEEMRLKMRREEQNDGGEEEDGVPGVRTHLASGDTRDDFNTSS